MTTPSLSSSSSSWRRRGVVRSLRKLFWRRALLMSLALLGGGYALLLRRALQASASSNGVQSRKLRNPPPLPRKRSPNAIAPREFRPLVVRLDGRAVLTNRKNDVAPEEKKSPAKEDDPKDLSLFRISHEREFLDSLTSCLHKECLNRPFHGRTHRVAVAAPPGRIGDAFHVAMTEALESLYGAEVARRHFELVRTTRVPPYGYGGNHGWTRILRLATDPLTDAVADAMDALSGNDEDDAANAVVPAAPLAVESEDDRLRTEAEAALRQIVRWHARLNHVAAHTSLYTVRASDLALFDEDQTRLGETLRDAVVFVVHNADGTPVVPAEDVGDEDRSLRVSVEGLRTAARRAADRATELFVRAGEERPWRIGILEDVLREETRSLDRWPSKSFWDVPSYVIRVRTSVPHKMARAMVPYCGDAEHVTCRIPKDLCEVRGDVDCKDQNKQ